MNKTTCLQNLRRKLNRATARGFSLVELLVVIAVIGIIAAIAIPNIAGITEGANDAKTQRNAQQIVSVYNNALATGWGGSATEVAAITAVTSGITYNGMSFGVENVDDTAAELTGYINQPAANGPLVYFPGNDAP